MSAALWCADLGMTSLIFERSAEFGGQLLHIYNPIKNYLGVPAANGAQLRDQFVKSLARVNPECLFNIEIANVDVEKKVITLDDGRLFRGRSLIIATGVRRRELGIEGEHRFAGKGILASGAKDPKVARGKRVAVIGGGDAAVENALLLAEHAEKVLLIHRGTKLSARAEFTDQALFNPKIELLLSTTALAFHGGSKLEKLSLGRQPASTTGSVAVDLAIVRIGVEPNTEFLRAKIDLDQAGCIVTNSRYETSAAGVYAAGDVCSQSVLSIAAAAGAGAAVSKAILTLLKPHF